MVADPATGEPVPGGTGATGAGSTSGSGAAAGGTSGIVLAEPVRQRLVQIASDVLGRLPAEDVPPALRPLAKFTPAKRLRLGAVALAAALDGDERFRALVADAVVETSPALAELVAAGTPGPASDPIDTAVVAYLTRPDGWTDLVAGIGERWSAEQAPREAAGEELARLRAEIADLRARLRDEKARIREAVEQASANAVAEAEQLRKQLRARTGEARAAERERDQARAEAEQARRDLADAEAASDAALRRLRARVSELERAAGSDRRAARTEREIDEARLRLLVDVLSDAAAGIRRELSLPAGTVRPADTVHGIEADVAADRSAADPARLDQLLALPHVHLVVDGYNVTKTGYGELPLAEQRTRLVSSMATLVPRFPGIEVTVAFDGGTRPPSQPPVPRGVRVLFSAADELADDLIRRLVAAEPPGRPVVVVTTDQQIVVDVTRAGAHTVPSAVLLARLRSS